MSVFREKLATLDHSLLFSICMIKKNWSLKNQKLRLVKDVRKKVGKSKVICALSGGVDSSVVAKLIHTAVGKQLTCVFVNTGLLRKNESLRVDGNNHLNIHRKFLLRKSVSYTRRCRFK